MLEQYVHARSTIPSGFLSFWEDELAASLVLKSYRNIFRLRSGMICSRHSSCAKQSASKTAEWRSSEYVASHEQGHLATPCFPAPTVSSTCFPRARSCPAKSDGLPVYVIRRMHWLQSGDVQGAAWWHGKAQGEMFSEWLMHWLSSGDVSVDSAYGVESFLCSVQHISLHLVVFLILD